MTMLAARRCAGWNRDLRCRHLPAIQVDCRGVLRRDDAGRVRGWLLSFNSHLAAFGGQTLAQGGGQQSKPRRQEITSIIGHGILTVPGCGLTTVIVTLDGYCFE